MGDVLVLCYHSISEKWPAPTAVRPGELAEQIGVLRDRGYRGATFTEAVAAAPGGEKIVAITFDDAHRSVYEHARPLLAEAGWPATVFAPTDFVTNGSPTSWTGLDHWLGTEFEQELGCASWPELAALADEGWEIGSHTCSHPHLSALDDDAIAYELAHSREEVERHLGRPCETLAYPYGDWDERVVAAAGAAGYRFAATAPTRGAVTLPLRWPRRVIGRNEAGFKFRFRISKVVRRVERSRIGPASEPLRRAGSRVLRSRPAAGRGEVQSRLVSRTE